MSDQAFATNAGVPVMSADALWANVLELSCEVTVQLAIPGFRVRDLIRLAPNLVIDTKTPLASDIPTSVNGTLLAWSELEVVGERLAIRITDFA